MQQCYIKLFLFFVFLPRYFVESLQLTWAVIEWNVVGFFFPFLSFIFFFPPQKALNRNLSLGLYFCIPASITITSEAGMIGRISRKNQDYELGLCKLEQKSRLTTGNLWENFRNAHSFLHTRMPWDPECPGFLQRLSGRVFHRTGFLKSESHQQPER